MPNYVKFAKEILSWKRRFSDYERVAVSEGCSALLLPKLPQNSIL